MLALILIMNNKKLVLAAIGIVAATSLVIVGTITVHSAEASGLDVITNEQQRL